MRNDEREASVFHRINERRLLRLVTPKFAPWEMSPRPDLTTKPELDLTWGGRS